MTYVVRVNAAQQRFTHDHFFEMLLKYLEIEGTISKSVKDAMLQVWIQLIQRGVVILPLPQRQEAFTKSIKLLRNFRRALTWLNCRRGPQTNLANLDGTYLMRRSASIDNDEIKHRAILPPVVPVVCE